jgi:heat shock protein HtpX
VKESKSSKHLYLQNTIDRLSRLSDIKKPKLGISSMSIPNAFAFGSPLIGNHVVITQGLLDKLNMGEIEAVLGHEIGHLKHKDVQLMMFVSFLPSVFFLLGRRMLYPSFARTYLSSHQEEKGDRLTTILGITSLAVYFILILFTLSLSRLREYYADRHSATIVNDGAEKLSSGLIKIVNMTNSGSRKGYIGPSFKSLFITDLDFRGFKRKSTLHVMDKFSTENKYLERKLSLMEGSMALFSTHPNITTRLRALKDNTSKNENH